MSFQPYDDPGWLAAFKGSKTGPASGLVTIRTLFLSLAAAPFVMLYVMTNIFETVGSPEPLPGARSPRSVSRGWSSLRARVIVLSRVARGRRSPPLRASFFVGFAGSEASVLVGFVACFLTDELWPYLTVLTFFLVGMTLIAPSRRNLDRREEQLRRGASQISLRAALNEPAAGQPDAPN